MTSNEIFNLLRNLDSPWSLNRSIQSLDTPSLSGTATGSATFTPLPNGQLLYHEKGTYAGHADPAFGTPFKAPFEKKYIWDLNGDHVSVHFVKQKQNLNKDNEEEEIDYLFHTLHFGNPEPFRKSPKHPELIRLQATGSHLCISDMYESSYSFHVRNSTLVSWDMKHLVKGPKKDQVIETRFT